MDSLKNLELLLNEYIEKLNTPNILFMDVTIPGFKGNLTFYNMDQLWSFFDPKETNSQLCLCFQFPARSKKEKIFLDKIKGSKILEDFSLYSDKNRTSFVWKTQNNTPEIVKVVNNILNGFFPDANKDSIIVNLKRIEHWHRLEENKTSL